MKIKLTILAFAVIIFSCNDRDPDRPSNSPEKAKRDTVNKFAAFMGYQLKSIHYGDINFITVDTLKYVYADTTKNNSKEWQKHTYAQAVVPITVDSALAVYFKVSPVDSTGKPTVVNAAILLDTQYVVSPVNNLGDALDYLKGKYLKVDSTTKK